MNNLIDSKYFDYASSTKGNSSSVHKIGQTLNTSLNKSRTILSKNLGVNLRTTDIYFTSGATESINTFIKGSVLNLLKVEKSENITILVSAIEHKAVLESANWLKKWFNVKVLEIPVTKDGLIDEIEYKNLLQKYKDTIRLISIIQVNNETGVIQNIKHLNLIAHNILDKKDNSSGSTTVPQSKYMFHTDSTAAVGHLDIDFEDLGIDAMSFSGHKFGTDIGIGGLITKRNVKLEPILSGGGQQRGVISGTVNYKLAQQLAMKIKEKNNYKELVNIIDNSGLDIVSNNAPKVDYIRNVIINQDPDNILFKLDQKGFQVSIGSACNAGSIGPSYVLIAMGYSENESKRGIRISFGPKNTIEETTKLVNLLIELNNTKVDNIL